MPLDPKCKKARHGFDQANCLQVLTSTLQESYWTISAQSSQAMVVSFSGNFNYAAECNLGVSRAQGSIIVLLNNDVELISPRWLDELVGHALQPGVGLVGALLLFPDDTIQHAGVILGANGSADPVPIWVTGGGTQELPVVRTPRIT